MSTHLNYDTDKRVIYIITPPVAGTLTLNAQVDIFSDMKEDWQVDTTLGRFKFPLSEPVGGNLTKPPDKISPYYFLNYGWRMRPYEADHSLYIEGYLLVAGGGDPWLDTIGPYRVNIRDTVPADAYAVASVAGNIAPEDIAAIAAGVWDADARNHGVLYSEGAVQQHLVYAGVIHIDITSGNTGTVFPVGTNIAPVNNWSDAKDIAENHGFTEFHIKGNLVIGASENINDMTLVGPHDIDALLFLTAGCTTQNTRIRNLIVGGTFNGKVNMEQCTVLECFDFEGFTIECVFADNVAVVNPATPSLFNNSGSGKSSPPIDIDIGDSSLTFGGWKGSAKLVNKIGANFTYLEMLVGTIEIDSTCVAGTIVISGMGIVIDNSSAGCTVITDNLHSKAEVADAVWEHTEASSRTMINSRNPNL